MDLKIKNFLERHRVLVLGVLLKDGTPYSATCHYAFNDEEHIIILTEKTTRKCEGLDFDKTNPASIAIGFNEEEWVEFQATGKITVVPSQSPIYNDFKENYESKFKTTLNLDESDVFLIFDIQWGRYTEFKRVPGGLLEIK